MKINQILALGVLCVGFVAFSGCKKEEGPAGPAGRDGNANVQTENITIYTSDWGGDEFLYMADKDCFIITEDIATTGVVMCYMKSGDYYTPIPFSITSSSWTTHIGFEYTSESIAIFFQDDDGLTPNPGIKEFKVVAIESSGIEANPDLDLQDYDSVKQTFKLAD